MNKTLPLFKFCFRRKQNSHLGLLQELRLHFPRGALERDGQAREFLPHTPSFPRWPAELHFLLEMGSR